MRITIDYSGSDQARIASSRLAAPIIASEIKTHLPACKKALEAKATRYLITHARKGNFDTQAEKVAASVRKWAKSIVIVGIGGASLSAKCLNALRVHNSKPTLHILDNIDPYLVTQVLSQIDIKTTYFLFVSKSGGTLETLSLTLIMLEKLTKTLGKNIAHHAAAITEPGINPMRQLARAHGLTIIDHDTEIGGRFSAFTEVGLLPAALIGLDVKAIQKGVKAAVTAHTSFTSIKPEHALYGAAWNIAAAKLGANMHIQMPYAEALTPFAQWHRQLWAESLGKNGKGTTPLYALGTTDQHSQLQLYLDGPRDKIFTFLTADTHDTSYKIPAPGKKLEEDYYYLKGKKLHQVFLAEQNATIDTFRETHVPHRRIHAKEWNEFSLGFLMMYSMLETIYAAALLDVNPYGQPAVEQGKLRAKKILEDA